MGVGKPRNKVHMTHVTHVMHVLRPMHFRKLGIFLACATQQARLNEVLVPNLPRLLFLCILQQGASCHLH